METAEECRKDSEENAGFILENAIKDAKNEGRKSTSVNFEESTWKAIQPKFEAAGFKFTKLASYDYYYSPDWTGSQQISWDI